jgi:hypothetical protein
MPGLPDDRSAADVNKAGPGARLDVPRTYLTDGVFLYRVVGSVASAVDPLNELEDCYGLDVVVVPASDVRSRPLRVVTAALSG